MRTWLRKWWKLLKAVVAVVILLAIVRYFGQVLKVSERGLGPSLTDLWGRLLHPGWLVGAAVLYLLGLGCSATYWYRLLRSCDQQTSFFAAVRAHYIGQMGKYLPGKAWALILRSGIVRGPGLRMSVAVATSFYEVLTTMMTGTLLAALLLAVHVDDWSAVPQWREVGRLLPRGTPDAAPIDPKLLVGLALVLAVPIGIPVAPPIFNWIVNRIALPLREIDASPLPPIRAPALIQGLPLGAGCWLFMGASLWTVFQAIMTAPPPWSWENWQRYTAFNALAYVASFVIVFLPSGLGVREFFLLLFLVPDLRSAAGLAESEAQATAFLAVVLLRLVWTLAEVVVVGLILWLPVSVAGSASLPSTPERLRTTD
jgi:hypothetical protein